MNCEQCCVTLQAKELIVKTQSFDIDCAHYNVLVIIIVVLFVCFKILNIWSSSICETLDYKFNMFFTSFILHKIKGVRLCCVSSLNYVSFETFNKLQVLPFFFPNFLFMCLPLDHSLDMVQLL